jgi:hypothetical protein
MIASIFFIMVDSPFKVALSLSIIVPIAKAQASTALRASGDRKLGSLGKCCLFFRQIAPKN